MTRTESLRQRLAEVGPYGCANIAVALWRREALQWIHRYNRVPSVREMRRAERIREYEKRMGYDVPYGC